MKLLALLLVIQLAALLNISSGIFFYTSLNENDAQRIPIFDKGKKYPTKKLDINIVKTYIPLETSKDILLDADARIDFVSNELLIITNKVRGDVFIFNEEGKVISKFNQKGGTGYSSITWIAYDEKNEEIYILDRISKNIFVYSENGDLKRKFKTTDNSYFTEIYNFDDNSLLVFDENPYGSNTKSDPYIYLSKKDGKVIGKVNITLNKVNPKILIESIGTNKARSYSIEHGGIPENHKFGNEFILANKSMDTIYLLKQNKELIPLFTQYPSLSSENTEVVSVGMISDQFIKICVSSNDIEKSKKMTDNGLKWNPLYKYYIFEINTGKFYIDESNGSFTVNHVDISKWMSVRLYPAYLFLDALKSGRLDENRRKVALKLKVGDNPIVELQKIK